MADGGAVETVCGLGTSGMSGAAAVPCGFCVAGTSAEPEASDVSGTSPCVTASRTRKVNTLPPSGGQATATSPPISTAKCRTMHRPSPVPDAPAQTAAPRSKLSKIRPRSPSGMPGPESRTERDSGKPPSACAGPPLTHTATVPRSVNFTALLIKLPTARRRRNASPHKCSGRSAAISSVSVRPFSRAAGRYRSRQCCSSRRT